MKFKKKLNKKGKTPAEIRQELRDIIYEARRQKLAQKAAAASRKAVSFSWEAVKSFVSDVKFKKEEQPTPNESKSIKTKLEQTNNKEVVKMSYYDRWYNIVTAKKTEL